MMILVVAGTERRDPSIRKGGRKKCLSEVVCIVGGVSVGKFSEVIEVAYLRSTPKIEFL